ncbi:MAG: 5-oxoprolinase subunit PxpB [Armatimonadota bacterium]|nr:5-oxoprolinase subunit PxpB [Armatimonadota bacterium]MDR5697853.1 5-oxoprolinase subunit PxpB [Armatimonadota bacterium]
MHILPFGESAVLVRLETVIDPAVHRRILALDAAVRRMGPGIETVPAYASLLVLFDRASTSLPSIARALSAVDPDTAEFPEGRSHEVPVAYGGGFGPDLADVARWAGISEGEVVRLHAGVDYRVYMLGFAPGFPYMGIVPDRIAAPRLSRPRLRVAAGGVGVAGKQTGIYPASTPGGWRILGRTPEVLFDPGRQPAALFDVGDTVRFVPIPHGVWREPEPVRCPEARGDRRALVVLRSGLHTTVQDGGRPGLRRYGVPTSGAIDRESLGRANAAVGNPLDAAALECTWPAPILEAIEATTIAVAGGDFAAEVDGKPIEPARALDLRPGQVLRFVAPRRGMWVYVAVQGGIDVPPVLGSRSTLVRAALGGVSGRTLRTGDILCVQAGPPGPASADVEQTHDAPIRILPGPHPDAFALDALDRFVRGRYAVSAHSDRSGYRLEGPAVEHTGPSEILSEAMVVGAVQVPPDGQPIVLMPDGPTTGGYPVLAVVAERDLGRLAQRRPGERVEFVLG